MIFNKCDIKNFLISKYKNEKIVVLFDKNTAISKNFVEELSKHIFVLTSECDIAKESVRCVVSFGKTIKCEKPLLYFASNISEFKICELVCSDFFCLDKENILYELADLLTCYYNCFCEKVFLSCTLDFENCFGQFNKILDTLKNNNIVETLKVFEILKKNNIYDYSFNYSSIDFDVIIKCILNFKLCEKFLIKKPFCEVLNLKSYSNKYNLHYNNVLYLNYCNDEICFRLDEFYFDFVKLTYEYGKTIKQIFSLFKKFNIEKNFYEINRINPKRSINEFISKCEKPKFCLINLMNKLGLI